jgi:hypothetical protein
VTSLQVEKAARISAQTRADDWLPLVRAEYLEMPGLRLTRQQVRRLWGLDAPTCDTLLQVLIAQGFLRRTRDGAYVRVE